MSRATPTAYQMFYGQNSTNEREVAELERLFYMSVLLPNGTFKTTNEHRLDDLNKLVNANLPPIRPLNLMDVAVSSGVSTAEWLDSLVEKQVECQMVAGDLTAHGFIVSAGFGLKVLTNVDGTPMQFDVRGRAVRVDAGRRERVVFGVPLLWLRMAAGLFRLFGGSNSRTMKDAAGLRVAGLDVRPVTLLSKRLGAFKNLEFIDDDILVDGRFPEKFHVLRAANILNLVYFDRSTLSTMVTNLQRRLHTGGLLVICRTIENGLNHATLFRKTEASQFEVVARLHNGSEIEDLVLAMGKTP